MDWTKLPRSTERRFLYDLALLPEGMTLEQVLEEYQQTGLISVQDSQGNVIKVEPEYTKPTHQYDQE